PTVYNQSPCPLLLSPAFLIAPSPSSPLFPTRRSSDLFEFCDRYAKLPNRVPLVAVPTSYHQVTERELADRGVNMVIYANHLLRAAYPQMVKVAQTILTNGRALEADPYLASIEEALAIIPENQR